MSFHEVKGNTQINPNNYHSSSVAPTQEKKQTYIGLVSKQEVAAFKLDLTTAGLWLIQKFYELKGDQENAVKTKFKIAHLKLDVIQTNTNNRFEGSLLVNARNIMSMDLFRSLKTQRMNIRDLEKQASKEVNAAEKAKLKEQLSGLKKELNVTVQGLSKTLKLIQSDVKGGVCAGACMTLAGKLLNAKYLSASEVINLSKDFETGVPLAGVITQYQYKITKSNETAQSLIEGSLASLGKENHLPGVQKTLVADILLRSILPENKFPDFLERHQQTMDASTADFNHLFGSNREGYYELRDKIKELVGANQFNTQKLNQAVKDIVVKYNMDPEQQKALENMGFYVDQYAAAIQKMLPDLRGRVGITDPKQETTEKTTKIAQDKFESNKDNLSNNYSKILDEDRVLNYPELHMDYMKNTNRENQVLKSRGLQLGDNTLGVKGAKNDEEALEGLKTLPEGVYYLTITTATGQHATTFTKTENGDNFFWDPNYGLLHCSKENPKKEVLDVLDLYSTPKGSPGNHHISIQKFSKITT